MTILGKLTFALAYRLSFLVAKWRLAWSYWNCNGQPETPVTWKR